MLKLDKKEKVFFGEDEEEVEVNPYQVDLNEFFIANLSVKVSFGEELKLEGLLNHFSEMREFIFNYFSEHYDKLKAIITSNKNTKDYVGIRFFKKLVVEEGNLYFQPSYDFITESDDAKGFSFMSQLPVYIDNNVQLIEESKGEYFSGKQMTCDITLQDVLEALFVDVVYDLTEGS